MVEAHRREALDRMIRAEGFDVVIVCTGTEHQARYWQSRLEAGKGKIVPEDCTVLCVHEDWAGGAGNGLGTLYAWRKACALAKSMKCGVDVEEAMRTGKTTSVALYHTAGKGTRLAPLPGSENNNKPGVKLPAVVSEDLGPLTILESVIKQTGVYGESRKGRLSVFWGDQIFVPTMPTRYDASRAHADILCLLAPMPDAATWAAKGLEKYGLVAVSASGSACQVEKVDHATAVEMTSELEGGVTAVGTSLGSFSLSSALLAMLDAEFDAELSAKKGQMDSDPHWWMPLTLPVAAYIKLMGKKGTPTAVAEKHHARMQHMLSSFENPSKAHILGPVDVGAEAYWWDYGQLKLYNKNAKRLLDDGVEADAMREFLGVSRGYPQKSADATLTADPDTCASNCRIKRGRLHRAVLANVAASDIDAQECTLVNVTAKKIRAGKDSIAYNVVDDSDEGLVLVEGEVVTDVFQPDGSVVRQRSTLDVDGGKAWKTTLEANSYSFEDMYNMNLETDIVATSRLATDAHEGLKNRLAL